MQILRRYFIFCIALIAASLPLYGQGPVPPQKPASVRFVAIGDMGTGELPQFEIAEKMNASRQTFHFDFVLMLGDNIYGKSNASDYHSKFELPYKALLDAGVQFYGALGNHDSPTQK